MRVPFKKRERFEVFKRDSFTCRYCGRKPPDVVLHVDHVVPVSRGGTNDILNLVTSCSVCNAGKGAVPLDVMPPGSIEAHNERTELIRNQERAVMEQVEQMRRLQESVKEHDLAMKKREDEAMARARQVWALWKQWCEVIEETPGTPDAVQDLQASIIKFSRTLPASEMMEAVELAFRKFNKPCTNDFYFFSRIRYFCGVCWRKIKGDYAEHGLTPPTQTPCT